MHASQVTGTRLVGVLVAWSTVVLVARALPEPELSEEPPPAPTYHYVPLSGYPLRLAIDELESQKLSGESATGTCLPFLAPIQRYPNWQIQIARGHSGCTGDSLDGSYAVHHDGSVEWSLRDRPTRVFHLEPAQFAQIRTLDQLDCISRELPSTWPGWYRVGIGGGINARDGATISLSSDMADALDAIFDERVARYYADRIAQLGPVVVHVTATSADEWNHGQRYELSIIDRHLTIRRGKRVVLEEDVELADLVDLVDVLASTEPLPPYVRSFAEAERYHTARGFVTVQGITLPFAFGQIEYGVTMFLANALYHAANPRDAGE